MSAEQQFPGNCNPLIAEARSCIGANLSTDCNIAHLNALTGEFASYFEDREYEHIESVPITAKVDPSVRFIGAPISVMKPLFIERDIPEPGAFMVQNCVRTRGVPTIFDTNQVPKYGSFFTGMCVLTGYERLEDLGIETDAFLRGNLGIDADDICINVNGEDDDLASVAKNLKLKNTFFNEKPSTYYRHKYGLDDIWGRNFNFGVRSVLDDEFEDIGNLIVIENEDEQIGVELALGDTTILKQIYGLNHILDAYGIDIAPMDSEEAVRRKFEDSAITSLALYREGLRPSAANNQTRLLRTYLKALSYYRRLLKIELSELQESLAGIETETLPFTADGESEQITSWIDAYEKQLEANGPVNKEDHVIISGLGKFAIRE